MRKKLATTLVLATSLLCPFNIAQATETSAPNTPMEISMQLDNPKATVNHEQATLEVAPTLINNVMMVPLRFLGESLGASVSWDDAAKAITMTYKSKTITLTIDQLHASVNGQTTTLEQPAVIMNNNTMVPLRFVAENLEQKVDYDNATHTIKITRNMTNSSDNISSNTVPEQTDKLYRLDKISADNLTIQSDIGIYDSSAPGQKSEVLDVTSDRNGNTFVLARYVYSGANPVYMIMMYDPQKGNGVSLPIPLHTAEFNFEVQENGSKQKLTDKDLRPLKFYYSENDNKLYLLCEIGSESSSGIQSCIIEISPSIKWITYQSSGGVYANDFLITADGETVYFSNLFKGKILKAEVGHKSETYDSVSPETNGTMIPLSKQGKLYLFDTTKQTISRMDADGIHEVSHTNIDGILLASSRNGFFYVVTEQTIYQIDVTGKSVPYVNLKEVTTNAGLYNPQTKTYDEPDLYKQYNSELETGRIQFTVNTKFTVDNRGNVIFFDTLSYMLRRINVYVE